MGEELRIVVMESAMSVSSNDSSFTITPHP